MAKIKAKKSEEVKTKSSKKIKQEKILSEEGETLRRFLIIFGVIIVIVIGIYVVTAVLTDKDDKTDSLENTVEETKIDYNIVNVGMILNRNQYDHYYVMVYDGSGINAMYYSAVITNYISKKDSTKIFYCDLGNALNKDYASEKSNPYAKTIEEFAFGEVTLLEIEKGKITNYVEGIDEIKTILQ